MFETPFLPTKDLARWIRVGMGLIATILALLALADGFQAWTRFADPIPATPNEAVATLALAILFAYLCLAALWLVWLSRTHRNLGALARAPLDRSTGWVLAEYFIPILNLYKPSRTMAEIASKSLRYVDEPTEDDLRVHTTIKSWWSLWIASGVISIVAGSPVSGEVAWTHHLWDAVSSIFLAASAFYACRVTATISRMQHEAVASLRARGGGPTFVRREADHPATGYVGVALYFASLGLWLLAASSLATASVTVFAIGAAGALAGVGFLTSILASVQNDKSRLLGLFGLVGHSVNAAIAGLGLVIALVAV